MAQLTIEKTFQRAIGHHQAGQLAQAENLYRQILAEQPDHAGALHYLGVIAYQSKNFDDAVNLIRRAIALKPDYADAYSNLGNVLRDLGQLDEAVTAARQAIAHKPNYPEAYNTLGNALRDQGQLEEAIGAYRRAVDLKPDDAQLHNNLANVLRESGQIDQAIAACSQAIALNSNYAEAYGNLANALRDKGQLEEAVAAYRRAVALNPDLAAAHSNLGNALREMGQLDQAIGEYRRAIVLKPDYAQAYNNLANALRDKGQLDEAIVVARQAIAIKPDYADAYINLGTALGDNGQLEDAIAAYHQAIVLKPDLPEAYNNLGNALKDKGQLEQAIAAFRQAMALRPYYCEAHSNLIVAIHYLPGYDARKIAQENNSWNCQFAQPLRQFIQLHANDRDLNRRLRIGYVSPDLRDHPVGRFLLPLVAHHDKGQVELFAYAQVPVQDARTQQLRSHVDVWRNIVGLSDAQAADLVRRDQIDILVDLAMHTAHNRLLVFARKPAPVQVTYLAYCSTTGLQTIDYRLSDPYIDSPGGDESIYSERTIRLAETYWCYQLGVLLSPISPLPALKQGLVTFGSLNNFCKVSESTLTAWAKLLCAVPRSQLLLHAREGDHRQRVLDRLERDGIEPKRVRFAGVVPIRNYFELYQQIDIALDPFPYGGGTTTCDALWMGVPVVSLAGKTAVGRGGLSILGNLGLPELVVDSEQAYVRVASDLANDPGRLSNLRQTLRQRMERSPLMDAPRFARNIEAAYRQMWRTWCQTPGVPR